jgi:hypothetical protein
MSDGVDQDVGAGGKGEDAGISEGYIYSVLDEI